jgi:hypothetical protein
VITLSALLVAALPGAALTVRDALGFRLQPQAAGLADTVDIATANAKVAALALVGALLARDRIARAGFDVLLTVVLTGNMAVIGAALGAYGPQLGPWLVHLPLELAALATPAGAYLQARRTRIRHLALLTIAALTCALLAVAALAETYLTPHL